MDSAGVKKLNVETYGGGIWSTFTDVPLKIAGRIVVKRDDRVESVVYTDEHNVVIPNVAIHLNRKINDGYVYNAQTDLCPLFSMSASNDFFKNLEGEEVLGYDLYVVHDALPFFAGTDDEFICSPRLDNLVCAFASLDAIVNSTAQGVKMAFLADSEEVGSRSLEGADSDFLQKTVRRINKALGYDCADLDKALARSFLVSADNAHAVHPNHPEYQDKNHAVYMNGGVVVKYNANQRYTTDGVSAAIFGLICEQAGVPVQRYANRADMPGGSTLGNIANTQVSLNTIDIGLPQLAMHSAYETAGARDTEMMVKALTAFFLSRITAEGGGTYTVV
jgi:aspartyl aminopeptidase